MASANLPAVRAFPTPSRRAVFRAVPTGAAFDGLDRSLTWAARHRYIVLATVTLLVASTASVAALLVRQDVATTPSASNAVVKFQAGSDYSSINAAGFATLSIPATGSSATMGLTGVSGAALTTLGNVLAINNTASAQNYTVTLARSTTLNAAITGFNVTIKDGASTLTTWDVKSAAGSSSYTHVAGRVLNLTVDMIVADATAVGSLGTFNMQYSLVPV